MKRKNGTIKKREKHSVFNLKVLWTVALLCAAFAANAQTRYYWVGKGDGYTWSNIMNWSATSGGQGGPGGNISQAPTSGNTMVFDVNSAVAAGKSITISGSVQCDSLIVESDASVSGFTLSGSTLTLNGSLLIKKTGLTWTTGNNSGSLYFASRRPDETIQTNGTEVFDTGKYPSNSNDRNVYFSGEGSWLLADDLTIGAQVYLQKGTLNLKGKNLSVNRFSSSDGKIIFPNSIITCEYSWDYGVASPQLTATETEGSLIRVVAYGFYTGRPTDQYHDVEFIGAYENHTISSGRFNKITFSRGVGTIGNANPAINSNLITDSLVILTTDHYEFRNITVNKHFEAHPPVCGGQVRLFQSDASRGGIVIGSSATTHIERAVIQDLKISGATVEAKKSYSWGSNSGWTFTAPDAGNEIRWVGGGGFWNDPAHWSTRCLPTLADNVIFDAGSGTIGSGANAVMLNGDAWCNNMTWDGVAGTPYFNLFGLVTPTITDYNKENYLMIGGSMQLQSTLTVNEYEIVSPYNSSNNRIYFVSNRNNESIVTNNAVKVAADIYFQSVSGTGKWTLTGDLNLFWNNNPASSFGRYRHRIYYYRGHLDISGQKIIAYDFKGDTDEPNPSGCFSDRLSSRTLNMANAVIDLTSNWYYLGGQVLTAGQSVGSSVLCGAGTATPNIGTKANDHYYNVELRTASTGAIYCNDKDEVTFFNKITVSAPGVQINSTVTNSGVIRPDSLLFTGNGTYTIHRNFTINNYLSTSAGCGGNTTLTADAARTITLGTAFDKNQANVKNTRLKNISVTPYTELGYKVYDCTFEGTSNGWNNENLPQRILYWVGGTGNWSDGNHWAEASGGDPTGCIPRQIDDVIFDDNSFSAAGQTVTIDANAYCHDMKWTGTDANKKPSLTSPANVHLYISGSLELQKEMLFKYHLYQYDYLHIHFISDDPKGETITSNGVTFNYSHMYFENEKGKWTLEDDFNIASPGSNNILFHFASGTLDLSGNTMATYGFNNAPFSGSIPNKSTRTLSIKNAIINLLGSWAYTGKLEAENSTINQTGGGNFIAEADAQYHNYNYNYTSNTSGASYLQGGKWNRLNINYSHRLNNVETDTLSLSANSSYTYRFQDIIRVNKAFYGNGTPCHTIYLQSNAETVPATLDIKKEVANMPGNILLVDYAYIHGLRPLTGEDNARLHKGPHSPDVDKSGDALGYGKGTNNYNNETAIGGANSWAIMDDFKADDTSPFGDDRMVGCHLFPYLLSSANFVPTAEARFKWFKCDYTALNTALKSISGTDVQKFNGLDGKLGTPESTAPEFWIDGSESATPYSLIVDYGNGCVAYDDITITMFAFAGCGLIETCVGDSVKDYFPPTEILSTVPNPTKAVWVMEDDELGTLTGEDGAKYSEVKPSELIMKAEYDGKKLIYYSYNEGNGSVLWADTITVRAVPPVMIWQGDESADWQTPTNWHPEGVPHSCTDVYIPGDVDYFPVLENDGQCRNIYFLPGAQLGHPQRLDYDFAHVQMNLGMVNGEQFKTDNNEDFAAKGRDQITAEERLEFGAGRTKDGATLARGAWHALAAPLKSVVTGDYAFGGFPFTYLRKYDINAQAGESFIAGRWSNYFSSTVEELKPGEGFVYWVNGYKDNDHRYMHKGSDWKTGITETQPKGLDENETFGLGELNGMLHLPYFEEEYLSSRHRNHAYDADNAESTFHLFWQTTTEANKGNLMHFVGGETGTETVQRADAYRFITETGSGEERTMDFTYSLPVNGAIAAGTTLLIGNPYVSAIDFAKFHTDNSTYIKNAAQVWNGTSFEIDAIIPPMQSFLVELNETEEASELELKFKIENISTTTTTTNLKSSVLRATATHPELKITASNPHVSAPAKVVWKEAAETYFCNTDISKIIEYPVTKATPEVYTLKAVHNSGKQRGLAIHSVNSEEALIPVGLIARHNGKMNLSLSGMDSFDATIKFIDTQSGEPEKDITGMNSFEYSFDYTSPLNAQNQAIAVEDRFFLRIGTRAATGMDGMSTEGKVYAYASGEDLVLVSSEQDLLQQFALYDADGRLIGRQDGVDKALHKVIGVLSRPGVYLVRMQTAGTVKEVKVIK